MRARKFDPQRWESVPITWETRFTDDQGKVQLFIPLKRDFFVQLRDQRGSNLDKFIDSNCFKGHTDVALAIQFHDALEQEFNCEIDDRKILVNSVKDAFFAVTEAHDAL